MDRTWEGQREGSKEEEGMTQSWQTPDVCGAPILPSGSCSLIPGSGSPYPPFLSYSAFPEFLNWKEAA